MTCYGWFSVKYNIGYDLGANCVVELGDKVIALHEKFLTEYGRGEFYVKCLILYEYLTCEPADIGSHDFRP